MAASGVSQRFLTQIGQHHRGSTQQQQSARVRVQPSSPSSFILASRMGGDGALVARILTLQIVIAAGTLPLWLALLA